MINVTAVGVVSLACKECDKMKKDLAKAFYLCGVRLEFTEVVYEDDTDAAAETCEKFGLDDLPSYNIGDIIFRKNFKAADVIKAVKKLND